MKGCVFFFFFKKKTYKTKTLYSELPSIKHPQPSLNLQRKVKFFNNEDYLH